MAVDKLVDSSQLNSDLTSVANAIRTKGGTSASLAFPSGFVTAIGNISTGGSSPLVSGTFTGSTSEKGSAKSITIPYSGSGYPIYGVIYPSGGAWKPSGTLTTLVQRYAIIWAAFVKDDFSATPDYSANAAQNYGETYLQYKNSDNDATVVAYSAKHNLRLYYTSAALAYTDNFWRINSSTSMSVFIANTSYGFPDGIEFTYHIIYSS